MYLPSTVNTCKSFKNLENDVPYDRLWYFYALAKKVVYKSRQVSIIHIFHKHKKTLSEQKSEMIINNIRRVAHLHGSNLLFNFLYGTSFI